MTVHIARQRFTPSASAPSVQAAGTERSPSTVIAIMIGVIITVSTMIPTPMLVPGQLDHVLDRLLGVLADQVLVDEGDQDQHPDQAVDHRRDGGKQPHHRVEDPPDAGRARTRR